MNLLWIIIVILNTIFPRWKRIFDTDTVAFIPHAIPILETTVDAFIRQSLSDITTLLLTLPKEMAPVLELGDNTQNGLLQVTSLLNHL